VLLDFTKTSLLDLTSPSGEPSKNASRATVAGANATWVNGVYQEISTFFESRRTKRDWLHSSWVYDFLVIIVGFPISFEIVYLLNSRLKAAQLSWPEALFIAVYVYVVLVSLFVFRLVFNYARWVLPKVEGPSRAPKARVHRIVLGSILLGLVSNALYSLGRLFW